MSGWWWLVIATCAALFGTLIAFVLARASDIRDHQPPATEYEAAAHKWGRAGDAREEHEADR